MPSPDLKIRRVCSAGEPAFDGLVAIYTEAHAENERKSPEKLEAMIRHPAYFFLVATELNQVVGFCILRVLHDSDAALLEYMAVARDRRKQGIGQRLFVETAESPPFSSKFLLAEVDSDKKNPADKGERIRRKAFYRRLGWREVDQLRYIMPPVSGALPPDMDMLVYKRDLPPHIERDRLRRWLERCYVEVYGMSANDTRIEGMVCALPAKVRLT